jgi:magnesium transporter
MTSIVNSVVYRDGKRIGDIAINDIGEAIQQAGTFVWLGMHEPDDSQLLRIQQEFGLHELAIEAAHHAHQRPKIEAYSNSLFIVLKTAPAGSRSCGQGLRMSSSTRPTRPLDAA